MKSNIIIKLHNVIFLIPESGIQHSAFREEKRIVFQWLFFSIHVRLFKRKGRWKSKEEEE